MDHSPAPVWAQPDEETVRRIKGALIDIQEAHDLKRSELVAAALEALAQLTSGAVGR